MADVDEFGTVDRSYEEMLFEWKIDNFFSVTKKKDDINCPSVPFMNTSWYLQLTFKQASVPGSMVLFLLNKGNLAHSVEFELGLKKLDGCVELLNKGVFEINSEWIGPFFIKHLEVEQRKSELVPSGTLTITCRLKRQTNLQNSTRKPEPKTEAFMNLDSLSEDLRNLYVDKESCDITLCVKDIEFKAHRAILMARSAVFSAMFRHETSEKLTGCVIISDCDPNTFEQFLDYLYSGKFENPSPRIALSLYETSEKYDVQELKIFCSEYLMENLTAENLCDVFTLADRYEDKKLQSAVQSFFNENLQNILVTSQWQNYMVNNHRLANKLLLEMSKMRNNR